MSYETRGNRRYYYSARKLAGRVVKTYEPIPEVGQIETARIEMRRDRIAAEREARATRARRIAEQEAIGRPAYEAVERVYQEAMARAGWHRIKRSPWRKRRTPMTTTETAATTAEAAPEAQAGPGRTGDPGPTTTQLRGLLSRAQTGDEAAMRELLPVIDEDSKFLAAWDLATTTEQDLIRAACGKNLVVAEMTRRDMVRHRGELAGPNPSAIEVLLAERAAISRVEVMWFEGAYARLAQKNGPELIEAHQRRIDRAHRRYLAALKALADVRRLNLTAIQINVDARADGTAHHLP